MEVLSDGIFQPTNVRTLGSYPPDEGGREVYAGQHREVVDHDRDSDRLRHRREVLEEGLFADFPVERRDDEHGVRADALRVAGELYHLLRAGAAGTRRTAERELAILKDRRESIERLEHDKDLLLDHYAGMALEALDSLTPEERHQVYKMLRLKVIAHLSGDVELVGDLQRSS